LADNKSERKGRPTAPKEKKEKALQAGEDYRIADGKGRLARDERQLGTKNSD